MTRTAVTTETEGYKTWSVANVPVVSGANTLAAYAVDGAGNISTTNTVKITDTP